MDREQAITNLATALIDPTDHGRLKWVQEAPNVFSLQTPSGFVIIQSRDMDGVAPFLMRIRDAGGNETDVYLDRDSSTDIPKLFHAVKRHVTAHDEPSDTLFAVARELDLAVR